MPANVSTEKGSGDNGAALLSEEQMEALIARFEERLVARLGVAGEPEPGPEPDETTGTADVVMQRLDRLSATVESLVGLVADQEAEGAIDAGEAPRSRPGIRLGRTSLEQIELAFEALITGTRPPDGIPMFYGLRDFYHTLSGDYEMTGIFQPERMPLYLANATSAVMASITANVLNKFVVNEYMKYPRFWEPAVTIHDFATLQDARWISLGGFGELPTVAEGAAYSEVTWDDFVETDAFVKKGGYIGLTIEAIDKDDVGKLRSAPRAIAQGAWKALGKSVSNIFTTATGTGPTMSDGNVLFDASNHGNLLTAAWSLAEFRTVKIAMMKQTEIHSGDRLGGIMRPYLVWVPVDLEDTVVQDLATWQDSQSSDWAANVDATGNEREARLANARRRVITVPFWTDTNNWAAQADPRLYPSIGLGFRFGHTPEIFSAADPRAGLMFSNDTLPVKVRFFYAVGPTDWRGLHKSNV